MHVCLSFLCISGECYAHRLSVAPWRDRERNLGFPKKNVYVNGHTSIYAYVYVYVYAYVYVHVHVYSV